MDLVEDQLKAAGVNEAEGFFVIEDHNICDISSTRNDSLPLLHRTHPLWCGSGRGDEEGIYGESFLRTMRL